MAGVSQQIPSYYGGISEQADQLKRPGQVKDVVNAIPDITWGLYKRPGSKRIGTNKLTNVQSNGSWFHYYRDETEGSYIGQIASDGKVRVWSCNDGTEKNVWYHTDNAPYDSGNSNHTAITSYLTPSSPTATEDLQALTINDTTYLTNRTKAVTTTGTTTAKPDAYSAYIEILRTENGRQYGLNISTPDAATDDTLNRATRLKIKSDTLDETTGTGNCPGIGTQVFSSDSGDKKNLIFRITSLGQVAQQTATTDQFKCTYNREIDLLHGGEGWVTNDEVTVTLDQAKTNYDYVVKVTDHETATLKGDVKLVRPAPTPFDAETAVTLDTVLGGIKTELSGLTIDGSALNTQIIGNGIYLS